MVTQTETPTEVASEEVAEAPVEEQRLFDAEEPAEEAPAADEQLEEVPEEPDKLTVLEQRLKDAEDKLQRYESTKSPEEVRQELEADLQRKATVKRQREEREAADKTELHESLTAALMSAGFADADPQSIARVGERFINKRHDQIVSAEINEVSTAFKWIDSTLRGKSVPVLSEKAATYAEQFFEQFKNIYGDLSSRAEQGLKDSGWVSADDHKTAVAAAVTADRVDRQKRETDVAHVQGQASTDTNSLEAWEQRVAHQGEDGFPHLSPAEWDKYRAVRKANGL